MKCPKNNANCPYNVKGDCHCPCRNCEVKDGCKDKKS